MYYLREIRNKDVKKISQWHDKIALKYALGISLRFPQNIDEAWLIDQIIYKQDSILCSIENKKTKELVGIICFRHIDFYIKSANLHFVSNDKYSNDKRIEAFAISEMLYHGFMILQLNNISIIISERNEDKKFIEELSFIKGNNKRNISFLDGQTQHMFKYSVSRNDYIKRNKKMKTDNIIPWYCISCRCTSTEKKEAILQCEDSFAISGGYNHTEIIDKICIAAELYIAYSDRLLGYCAFYANDVINRRAYISLICVKREYQGMGIGNALLTACEALASQKKMKALYLEVKKNNDRAISLYAKHGFIFVENNSIQKELMYKNLIG